MQASRNTLLFSKPLLNHLPNHSYPPLYYPQLDILTYKSYHLLYQLSPLFQLKQIPLRHLAEDSRPGYTTHVRTTFQGTLRPERKTSHHLSGEII